MCEWSFRYGLRLCVGKFAYLLKFIGDCKSILNDAFMVICRYAQSSKDLSALVGVFPAGVKQGDVLPSSFSPSETIWHYNWSPRWWFKPFNSCCSVCTSLSVRLWKKRQPVKASAGTCSALNDYRVKYSSQHRKCPSSAPINSIPFAAPGNSV